LRLVKRPKCELGFSIGMRSSLRGPAGAGERERERERELDRAATRKGKRGEVERRTTRTISSFSTLSKVYPGRALALFSPLLQDFRASISDRARRATSHGIEIRAGFWLERASAGGAKEKGLAQEKGSFERHTFFFAGLTTSPLSSLFAAATAETPRRRTAGRADFGAAADMDGAILEGVAAAERCILLLLEEEKGIEKTEENFSRRPCSNTTKIV